MQFKYPSLLGVGFAGMAYVLEKAYISMENKVISSEKKKKKWL